ncbi:MAG: hypothetical protein EAZ68_10825 [Oscillatoriales cyanobacterium]|nr:MAG: hypothetical protein EAZ68_10825 [Oscillatoriales cyanobacterium]
MLLLAVLPPAVSALGEGSDAPGLVAAGGTVNPARLQEAYSQGIFPWYGPGQPVLWWSPDPRMVLQVSEFKLSHSLKKTLRRFLRTPGCEVRFDHDFRAVITACAGTPREGQDGTWIVAEMVEAYCAWYRATAQQHQRELARWRGCRVEDLRRVTPRSGQSAKTQGLTSRSRLRQAWGWACRWWRSWA